MLIGIAPLSIQPPALLTRDDEDYSGHPSGNPNT